MVILIAEDDKLVQKAYLRILRNSGHEIIVKDTAVEALQLLKEGLRPDRIISDLEMPGMLGSTFCHEIRNLGLKTPFLLVSGAAGFENLAKSCGADSWGSKGGDAMTKIREFTTNV